MDSSADSPYIRILFLGDVMGEPGRKAVTELLPVLKQELQLDFMIVNGENAAAGTVTPARAAQARARTRRALQ